jgi:serine/threonine protein kinase
MTVDPDRWQRVQEICDAALSRPAADRAAFIQSACGDDASLRQEVEELLAHEQRADGFLSGPLAAVAANVMGATAPPPPKETIGPYRLLQPVGEGGMGEVWLAEQTHPVHRQVALKVIKAGMDTAQVVARFEAERQALALMDHPAIARVFDAGATPHGRLYFVMEYVRGESITHYVTRQKLSIRHRIDLFIQICEGVQHAHQKGIIHRDLNPSNILVTLQNDRPVPKIIDFGVAKAMTHSLTERTLHTELGALVGTPEYMSPEQAEMSSFDIDTRTDVYALGVVLYELLTDMLPFEAKSLREKGLDEIRRTIREVDPPNPSTKVTMSDSVERPAASGEAGRLANQLRGDLDWITMKALEKDRTRRYATVGDFAADLQRHLDNQPVLASPPSGAYRVQKFVRRNRLPVAATAAFIVMLLIVTITSAIQAKRIARERDRADQQVVARQRVVEFLKGLFRVSDPSVARGNAITAREILDRGVQRLGAELRNDPETRAELIATIGEVFESLGLYAEAESLLRQAVADNERLHGEHHAATQEAMETLGWTLGQQGRWVEAQEWFNRASDSATIIFGTEDVRTLRARNRVGAALTRLGHYSDALPILLQTTRIAERVLGADHPETLNVMNNLAVQYSRTGQLEEAMRIDTQLLVRRRRSLGVDHPAAFLSANNLAVRYILMGRHREAAQLIEETLPLAVRVWGLSHPDYGTLTQTLGEALLGSHDFERANEVFERALTNYRNNGHRYLATLLYELAQVAAQRAKPDAALKYLDEALTRGYQAIPPASPPEDDPALASLKADPRFIALVSKNHAGR